MKVYYRVQDDKGVGPYQTANNSRMMYRHSDSMHPTPYQTRRYKMQANEQCAFSSMRDLYRWFGGYLPGLLKNGYSIVRVTGTVTYTDSYQVVLQYLQER